jgi:hypothetical protein
MAGLEQIAKTKRLSAIRKTIRKVTKLAPEAVG